MKNSNVSGELAIELRANWGPAVDTILDASDDEAIPALTPDMVLDIGGNSRCYEYELVIDFYDRAYYDSFRRSPVRAYLMRYEVTGGGAKLATKIELSSEKMNALFNHFEDKINEVELEESY